MIKKLFLDLNNFKANLGSVERGDSIELNIKLLDSEDYSRSKFRVLGAKADGKYVEQIEGINLEEKDLKIVLEDQFVNCEGIVKLELNVVSGETEITTKEFYFFVSNTMNASIIDSADSLPTLEKVSKYVDDAVNNLDALKEASADITIINSEFKENEIKRKANELLRERSEKERVRLESIRTTEEADRIKAEVERKEAENNRKVAESNRKLAENTRKTNEAARVEAELNRQSLFEENEEIRNENENLRIEAEKERKLTFSNNNKFESERVEAEKLRCIAEDKRVTAEKARANAEEERIKAETRRENTYTDFNDSEVERRNNEANRVRAEAERVNAESGRNELFNTNEEKRNSTFIESERTRERAFNEAQSNRNEAYEESERVREEAFKVSEAARNEAEEGRVAAEVLRVEAEKLRVAGEENRNNTFTQSEEERKANFEEAENARKVAESKRVAAETGRVEAEKLRVTAETERVEAENLRVISEEGRVAAETKREEGFNAFEGRISANTEELKNARSATTGEKFNTLDERIDCEVDRLNKKIDVTMLQQEDKESHTIENTVEGMTTDMVIKGRTLHNLVTDGNRTNVIDNSINTNSRIHNFKASYNLQRGKKYVGYLKIDNIENAKYGLRIYGLGFGASGAYYTIGDKAGVYKFTWNTSTAPETITEFHTIGIYLDNEDFVNGGKATFSDFMLFEEGTDLTNIDKYFEGIKSFGQEENKISILSHGKNLLSERYRDKSLSILNIYRGVQYKQFLKENTQYTLSLKFKNDVLLPKGCLLALSTTVNPNEGIFITLMDSSGNVFDNQIIGESLKKSENLYVTFYNGKTTQTEDEYEDFINKIDYIQIEEGTQATQYEPYKENKKDILLPFSDGLKSVGNVCDELVSNTKKAIERIQKDVFVGNEDWTIRDDIRLADVTVFRLNSATRNQYKTDGFLICNKFNRYTNQYQNYEGIRLVGSESYGVTIGISKSKLTTDDSMGFKNLLKKWNSEGNPLILYSEMTTPVEHDLPSDLEVNTYQDKTYVEFQNSISGTSSFKAPVNAAATISRLNRENRALEEENRRLRQDFELTTLSLTDSDLELVKQNVDIDFRLMEVEFALDIPQAILSSDIKFKNKKGEVKNMARTPYQMLKIVILSGDYDREDYIHKVGKYYERGRMTKEEYDELMSLMTADEVISK